VKRFVRENGAALALAVMVAAGLKLAYSRLGPDQLTFMTGPTQALVTLISGCDFTYESHYGYVSLPHRIVIAKSCTGVNYLLAVFGMLAFTLVPAAAGQRAKALALAAAAAVSYAATVGVNALRIALGIALRDAGRYDEAIREFNRAKLSNPRYMPARLHLGITYYSQGFFGLAEEEWQEALVFDPKNSAVRTYLNFVKPQTS
jgi:exosortase K